MAEGKTEEHALEYQELFNEYLQIFEGKLEEFIGQTLLADLRYILYISYIYIYRKPTYTKNTTDSRSQMGAFFIHRGSCQKLKTHIGLSPPFAYLTASEVVVLSTNTFNLGEIEGRSLHSPRRDLKLGSRRLRVYVLRHKLLERLIVSSVTGSRVSRCHRSNGRPELFRDTVSILNFQFWLRVLSPSFWRRIR